MIYVMSDIHGCYEKYKELLKIIDFKENDTLYVLGDVFDRGGKSIDVIKDMMSRKNIIPIIGNHDNTVYNCLKELMIKSKNKFIEKEEFYEMSSVKYWIRHGGQSTIEELKKCSENDVKSILQYIESFSLSKEIKINGNRYVLVHGSLENFSPEKQICEYTLEEVCFNISDYNRQYFPDNTFIITGHMPTFQIEEKSRGKIYYNKQNIAIDCGAAYGEKLACLCLNNMQEYYI